MKKTIVLSLLLLTCSLLSFSQTCRKDVSEAQARQTAHAFIQTLPGLRTSELNLVSASDIFIYNIGTQGFIIISGNTILPPILGYSNQGVFPSMEEAPENFSGWIRHYSDMIHYAIAQDLQPEPKILQMWEDAQRGFFPTKSTTTVDPLIATRWNQDCFYNEYCPSTGGGWWGGGPCGHAYAGCVACAMAQVMKYWNWPEQGIGSHSYTHSEYGVQHADFGATTYQWDQMPIEIYSHNDAVATLMYHCGVSVNMNYGPGGSGAQSPDVEYACRSYFGYCGAKYRQKSSYSEEDWIALIKDELDLSHPFYYSGSSGSAGHAFVCDGYDSNDLIHFNFGWSGAGDSYCSLYDVNGYNQGQAAVFNMVPMDIRPSTESIIYVTPDGEGNGTSWGNATRHLEAASYLSNGGNVQVWVKQGTYYGDTTEINGAFQITANNKVYGSFVGDEAPDYNLSQRDFENHATILDGQGVRRVLNQEKEGTASTVAVWDGFVIQNGESGSGSGVFINGFVTLSHCTICDNHTNAFGGGIYVGGSNTNNMVSLYNCRITGNSASLGGALCDRSNTRLVNCIISNNYASTKGGGAYLYNSATTSFQGCLISNNTATEGGGLYSRGKHTLQNCTVVMNEASESAGGVFNEQPQNHASSCIFWGNSVQDIPGQIDGSGNFEYCAVQGGVDGENNIDLPETNDGEEPGVYVRFVRPASGAGTTYTDADWSTDSRSICVNRGKPGSSTIPNDLNGQQRIQHDIIDIGAYESNASLTLMEADIQEGETYWFNGRALNEPGYYTTVYPTSTCDSVVGLTLKMTLEVQDLPISDDQVISTEVFSLLGQRLATLQHLDELKATLKPGCYLLRIQTTDGIYCKKMIFK